MSDTPGKQTPACKTEKRSTPNQPGTGDQVQKHNPRKNTTMSDWETIEAPVGSFIGWGGTKGQHVTGKVLDFTMDGGTDFGGNRCPQISIELTEAAASFNKAGERRDIPAGETVNITAGQVKLKTVLSQTNPSRGDEIRIELKDVIRTNTGNTLKDFLVQIRRGNGAPAAKPVQDSFEAPF